MVDPILLTQREERLAAICHLANDSVNEGSPPVSICLMSDCIVNKFSPADSEESESDS